jgi:uncharacterized protein (TIGR04255 family)
MATPRVRLQRSPVVEAIVDVRAKTDLPEDGLRKLAAELKSEFPKIRVMQSFEANLEIKEGKLVPPSGTGLRFGGVHLLNEDETQVAQFGPDGFTFNNLRRYVGGDELLSTATRLWNHFAAGAHPSTPTRIAMRYINRLELPIAEGVDLDTFLTAVPPTPEHLPSVAAFLSRIVAHDPPNSGAVVLTQRLFTEESKPIVVIDIDAILEGEEVVARLSVPEGLATLRTMANRTFFAVITEETARLYD